ncbi:MAG: hypothetical protein FD135_4004 [Comamonadaceae bacterium]|nr:MAG: hypothetical protein FD135_4004 [Comamonadaceae bacterium]
MTQNHQQIRPMFASVDGKERVKALAPGQVSDYLVLEAGQHTLSLQAAGKTQAAVSAQVTAPRGGAMTVAFISVKGSASPVIFEDKKGNNKLKSMLSVYQLALPETPVDISTSNGKTKVFSGLAYASLNAIQVNPIKVELKASKTGDSETLATASLDMIQGSAYSVFLLPKTGSGIHSYTTQNKVERYTGK